MTENEEKAWEAIAVAFKAIHDIDDEEDSLKYNTEELVAATHTFQQFVQQHILHRLDPNQFSDWWGDRTEWQDGEEG